MAEEKKKKKGHKFQRTHIEHFKDGSGTVEHHHEEGAHKNVKHAVGNIDEMHDSVEEHLGAPNAGEAEADGGDHGIPAEHAEPAGIPEATPAPAPNALPLPGAGQ